MTVTQDPLGAIRNGEGPGIPKVALPLGAIVIRRERVNGRWAEARYVKVRMDGPTGLRWKLYARWWWEKNRGPVPSGKLVLHVDGDMMNDTPENLALGTPGDKAVLAHQRDESWARAQYASAVRGMIETSRMRGKVNRLHAVLPAYWYPVVDWAGIILNVPFRRRKPLLGAFGVDVRDYPKNGRSPILRDLDPNIPRPVRGRDLGTGILSTYLRYDPELEAGSHGALSKVEEDRIGALQATPVWSQALEAAKIDLRKR